jgi:hypothetical protein
MTSPARTPTPGPPPLDLAAVVWGWGDAYVIGYQEDQWTAARRDGCATLIRPTLAALETVIEADYRTNPVSRAFDPPGSTWNENKPNTAPSEDESVLLTAMREAFPAWAISYDSGTRSWTAQTRKTTVSQPTAVLLCAALVLADRRPRRTSGPGPGPGLPPGGPDDAMAARPRLLHRWHGAPLI